MIPDRYLELINQEIDGVNSPDESQQLERYLEDHPDAQVLYRELLKLGQIFDHVASVDPPGELRARILAAAALQINPHPKPSFINTAMASLRGLGRPQLAWVFGAGLIAGLVLFALVGRYLPDVLPEQRDYGYGTINDCAQADAGATSDRSRFDLDGANGLVTVSRLEESVLLTLELESTREVEIRIDLDPRARFAGFSPRNGGDCRLSTTEGSAELVQRGEGTYDLRFTGEPGSPVRVTVIADGMIGWERTFGGRR